MKKSSGYKVQPKRAKSAGGGASGKGLFKNPSNALLKALEAVATMGKKGIS